MKMKLKKLLRTMQNNFPFLLELKFSFSRFYRCLFGIPSDRDFNALSLFNIPDNAEFLDIGGNRGQCTDSILMRKENWTVQIFEPNPGLFKKLKQLFGGIKRVEIWNYGLGEITGEFPLFIPRYKKWIYDGFASPDKKSVESCLLNAFFRFNEKHLSIEEVPCRIVRLDDLGLSPFFIKLDILGCNLNALKGGISTLMEHEPILLVKGADKEIKDYLGKLGYNRYYYYRGSFIRDSMNKLKTFFITDRKLKLLKIK